MKLPRRYLKIFGFVIFCVALTQTGHTQNQGINNYWLMGYASWAGYPNGNTIIDYSSGNPVSVYDSMEMEFSLTNSTISDSMGNLLFYTNGVYIADASNDTMQNGSGLSPSVYVSWHPYGLGISQGSLILKSPGSNSLYYLFHGSQDCFPNPGGAALHLYYSIIDMNGNGGLGSVIQKNVSIIDDSLNTGKISATRHANGRDWWIVCHRVNTDQFYLLLLTPWGVSVVNTQNIGNIRTPDVGQAKFSPDGSWYSYFSNGKLDIFNFDRCSGTFSNHLEDNFPNVGGGLVGCEFSSYSNMLYVSNVDNVYQYTLGPNILATKTLVATYDGFFDPIDSIFRTYLCVPQLAPDGKIYITTGNGSRYFHVIHFPYLPGTFCNLVQHDLVVPAFYINSIPNHPNYFLGKIPGSPCDTVWGVGLEEPPEIVLKVWPNPVVDDCTFSFPVHSGEGKLQVYDLLGSNVFEESIAPWSQFKRISLNQFPTGMYLCRMSWGNKSATVKVMRE